MKLPKDVVYIGVNDHTIDLFEGQYVVPNGMAYNSYVLMDTQIAVFDTVDARYVAAWLANLEQCLAGRQPNYLIVQHMEPDHSAGILAFMEKYKDAAIVASAKAFSIMRGFFGTEFAERRVIVGEQSTLSTGAHTLTFLTAPMVHWPEVIVTYDATAKTVFSADAFGKFGALDTAEDWACEARRYYFGIVGKYGAQVQALLKKLAGINLEYICPLHGPVLGEDLSYYLGLYQKWSTYTPENEGVVIAYTSVYGNTRRAAERLGELLTARGCRKVVLNDLARCDWAEAVEDAFRYNKLVLATTTYNADIFPAMRAFLDHLTERGYQKRTIALVENGSWAPVAAKKMREILAQGKELRFLEPIVTILSAPNADTEAKLSALAEALLEE